MYMHYFPYIGMYMCSKCVATYLTLTTEQPSLPLSSFFSLVLNNVCISHSFQLERVNGSVSYVVVHLHVKPCTYLHIPGYTHACTRIIHTCTCVYVYMYACTHALYLHVDTCDLQLTHTIHEVLICFVLFFF